LAITIEMPTDEPMLRVRLSRLDPSVRSSGGRVAKAVAFRGMNTSPMPRPWTAPDIQMLLELDRRAGGLHVLDERLSAFGHGGSG